MAKTPTQEAERHQYRFVKLHNLDLAVAKERAERLAISLEKKKLIWHWQDGKIPFQVKEGVLAGTHGELLLFPGRVEIIIDGIPEYLLIFDPIIQDRVTKKLQEFFKS